MMRPIPRVRNHCRSSSTGRVAVCKTSTPLRLYPASSTRLPPHIARFAGGATSPLPRAHSQAAPARASAARRARRAEKVCERTRSRQEGWEPFPSRSSCCGCRRKQARRPLAGSPRLTRGASAFRDCIRCWYRPRAGVRVRESARLLLFSRRREPGRLQWRPSTRPRQSLRSSSRVTSGKSPTLSPAARRREGESDRAN